MQPKNDADVEEPKLTFFQLLFSVLAAGLGVQSSSNRARDFERGNPIHFALIGITLTVLFVALMIALVGFVLQ